MGDYNSTMNPVYTSIFVLASVATSLDCDPTSPGWVFQCRCSNWKTLTLTRNGIDCTEKWCNGEQIMGCSPSSEDFMETRNSYENDNAEIFSPSEPLPRAQSEEDTVRPNMFNVPSAQNNVPRPFKYVPAGRCSAAELMTKNEETR